VFGATNVVLDICIGSPFNNPSETYRYYSFPFCYDHTIWKEGGVVVDVNNATTKPKWSGAIPYRQTLGQSLVGDFFETSPYHIHFKENIEFQVLCKKTYDSEKIKKLQEAIANNYFYEMLIEDLPMWGYVGDVEEQEMVSVEAKYYLFPNVHFHLGYNNDQVVSARITTDVSLKPNRCLPICFDPICYSKTSGMFC
jgi:Endomembrane protein 70